tara:strand:- start:161 stop:364 length:204 start_codon:yes stop_codon:yes gene_type:complete
MLIDKLCKNKEVVAYRSCVDSYFSNKDKKDIMEYWLQLFEQKRFCEAKGVEKALELIDIYEDLNAKD